MHQRPAFMPMVGVRATPSEKDARVDHYLWFTSSMMHWYWKLP